MNPVLLQKQLKENVNDLKDFCSDLKGWGDEMKRKEDSLKNVCNSKKPKVEATKTTPRTTPIQDVPKGKISKIGSTDYAKWEKFDADLECDNLEEDSKDDSELTDEFEETPRDEALVHKEKGNSHVKLKEWDKAITCYTNAINCYSYDPVFYANRALCYFKKNSFISAEEDCTLSLRLDPTYVKAFQRRAAAREAQGKLEQAASDLEVVLTHEPKNTESTAALGRIRKKMGVKEKSAEDDQRPVSKFTASRNKTQPPKPVVLTNATLKTDPLKFDQSKIDTSVPSESDWPHPGCDIIKVKAIKKPPHVRSKKPLKRIAITEVGSSESSKIKEEVPENTAFKKHVVEHVKQKVLVDDTTISEPVVVVETTSAFKKNREKGTNEEKSESLNRNAWPKSSLNLNDIIRSDDLKVVEKKPVSENKPKEVKNTENIFITKMDNNKAIMKDVKDPKSNNNTVAVADCPTKEYTVPKTSVQFYNCWKTLKGLDEKYQYLKLVDPQEIPKLFKESLDSKVFSGILEVLSTSFIENEEEVYYYLTQLTQVKRFAALAMFMDDRDKNCLWKLVTYLREKNKMPKENVDNLVLEYEL